MSNIGKQPINVPEGVEINIINNLISVKGPKGNLDLNFNSCMQILCKKNVITVVRPSDDKQHKEFHGLYRALIQNMVEGVSKGFSKELKLVGVGYTTEKKGNFLIVNAGYSHPVYVEIPKNMEVDVPDATTIVIRGASKQNVGDFSAKIRQIRKPEPYKGKGIKYSDEFIRRKAGKTVGAK